MVLMVLGMMMPMVMPMMDMLLQMMVVTKTLLYDDADDHTLEMLVLFCRGTPPLELEDTLQDVQTKIRDQWQYTTQSWDSGWM